MCLFATKSEVCLQFLIQKNNNFAPGIKSLGNIALQVYTLVMAGCLLAIFADWIMCGNGSRTHADHLILDLNITPHLMNHIGCEIG